jgi:hypothetical protein
MPRLPPVMMTILMFYSFAWLCPINSHRESKSLARSSSNIAYFCFLVES